MDLSRACGALLRLYSLDYQLSFAAEMRLAFAQAAAERRGRGRFVLARFAFAELRALAAGVITEWIVNDAEGDGPLQRDLLLAGRRLGVLGELSARAGRARADVGQRPDTRVGRYSGATIVISTISSPGRPPRASTSAFISFQMA
jgi:hypothetical protein